MRRTLATLTLTAALLGLTAAPSTAAPLDTGKTRTTISQGHKWTSVAAGHKWTKAPMNVNYAGSTRIYTTSYFTADRQCETSRGPYAWVRGPFTDMFGRTYYECIR